VGVRKLVIDPAQTGSDEPPSGGVRLDGFNGQNSLAAIIFTEAIMLVTICKSKIHRARITGADLNYEGSITIDKRLLEEANILANEKVQVVNLNNGARFETYILVGRKIPESSA